MRCTNCGTTNGKTNKFCRECGASLELVAEPIEQSAVDSPAEHVCALDDVALGEELFGVMRLYESGDLDAASERISQIMACSPESASAHSIKALICERKADIEAAQGNQEISNGYLMAAIAEYEAIIDLNPDSGADREKLVMLRMKMAGKTFARPAAPARPVSAPPAAIALKLRDYARNVPPPVLASGATLVVLLVLLSVLIPSSNATKSTARASVEQQRTGVQVAATPAVSPRSSYYGPNPAPATNNYSTPPPAPAPMPAPAPVPQVQPVAQQPAASPGVEPIKLPSFRPELVLVPTPKKSNSEPKPKPAPNANAASEPKIKITVNDTPDDSSSAPDGSTLLNKAISLGNQGKYSEAIQTAQQAVGLYQGDLTAGRNTTAAQRGVSNASRYIQLWQSMQTQ